MWIVEQGLLLNLGVGGVFALLVIDRFTVLTKWMVARKNGKNGSACRVAAMLEADPPRKHTELLEEILRELRGMRKDLRSIPDLLSRLRR